MSNSDKIALVTGATGGLGRATSIAFAKAGYTLALHYNSASQETVSSLMTACTEAATHPHPIVKAFQADLSSMPAVRSLHATIVSSLGHPLIVFLNAGSTCGLWGPSSIADVSLELFTQTWTINTASPFLLTQLCLPAMEEAGYGRVVFNSSVAGITGGVVGPHYSSSKAAIHGLVHWLAGNVAGKGITVNAVAPALVESAMLPGGGSEELAKKIPVGRFGHPDEVASTVLWMVGNGYVTNKVIAVDGGMVAR